MGQNFFLTHCDQVKDVHYQWVQAKLDKLDAVLTTQKMSSDHVLLSYNSKDSLQPLGRIGGDRVQRVKVLDSLPATLQERCPGA